MIKRLKYSEVDFASYARCVQSSVQRNFYADKEILNEFCEAWELLVYDDYRYVMAVPLIKKYGFAWVSMPVFIQQLGVFGPDDSAEINSLFLKQLLSSYRVISYSFNYQNSLPASIGTRKNYVILAQDYHQLSRKGFSKGRKSVLKKITGLHIKQQKPNKITTEFIQSHFKGLNKTNELAEFIRFITKFSNRLQVWLVFKDQTLITVGVFTQSHENFGLLALINDDRFKHENAASFLIDEFLKQNIEAKALDFMGGNIRGIEIFFKSFGAGLQIYPVIQNSKKALIKNFIKRKKTFEK